MKSKIETEQDYQDNLEEAAGIFARYNLFADYTFENAVKDLFQQTDFDLNRGGALLFRHDSMHVLANAVFGAAKDEEAVMIAEYTMFEGSHYPSKNPNGERDFTPRKKSPAFYPDKLNTLNKTQIHAIESRYDTAKSELKRYARAAQHAFFHEHAQAINNHQLLLKRPSSLWDKWMKQGLLRRLETTPNSQTPPQIQTNDIGRQLLSANFKDLCLENGQKPKEDRALDCLNMLLNKAWRDIDLLKNAFPDMSHITNAEIMKLARNIQLSKDLFETVSGGRAMHQLSIHELKQTPLCFFGIEPTYEDEEGVVQFLPLRPAIRQAIMQDLQDAQSPNAEQLSAPAMG